MRLERDVALDGLPDRLNETLPPGIRVTHIEQADERAPALQTQVVEAEYQVELREQVPPSELKRRIESALAAESILRERRGKKYDLRPLIHSIEAADDTIVMLLAAREGATGRPEEVLDVLGIAFEETKIERTRLVFNAPQV